MVKKILAKSYLWLILLLLYAPILLLVFFSFTDTTTIGTWNGFSFKPYQNLFGNKDIMTALKNTVILALTAGVASTILGTVGAIGIFYSSRRSKTAINAMSQIPVVNAEIVTALSLRILFAFFNIKLSFLTLLIGHVVLTVPFVVLSILPKLQQMDNNVYEAALDLGATPSRALWSVLIPQIAPGIIAGFILALTLSLDDYIITAYTRSDSFSTISTIVEGAVRIRGLSNAYRALTTLIFLAVLGILITMNIMAGKKKAKLERKF